MVRKKQKRKTKAEMDGLCQQRHESHQNDERKLAGGELCLPQQPHNQVGAARREPDAARKSAREKQREIAINTSTQ